MPLEEPKLDDREFEQLVRELRLRIPRYTKDWTNFNDSDPGITLLHLFAWLSEMMLFRMNQVPLKNYIKFLKLLGQELRPARPARARLTFTATPGAQAKPVPERAQVSAQIDDGGEPLIFETERGLDVISLPLEDVGIFDGAAFINVTEANKAPGTKFRPFGFAPDVGNAFYLGFKPPDEPLDAQAEPFPQEMTFAVFLPPETTAGRPQKCTGEQSPPVPPVSLVWEFRPRANDTTWQRLNVFEDETAAFTREGYIRVEGPREIEPSVEARLSPTPRFWIRVRIAGPATYPAGRAPQIDFLRPNTVNAVNLSTVRGEILGESQGQPGEQFQLLRKPVDKASLKLRTELPDSEPEQWTKVEDFYASKAGDSHYTLNATAAIIQFGDGTKGRIPEAGAQVIATEYRYGGGARGNNAGKGSIKNPQTVLEGIDKVTNERPAVGGADEQTLEEIKTEAPSLLRQRNRAVTPEDFKASVEEMGGVAKARALSLFHPDHPGVEVPGAVTVVIVPDNEEKPPKPSGDLIREICAALDEKRLLTTEVFVKGPEYQEVRVEARVTAEPYASFNAVTISVIKALDKLLDPRQGKFGEELFPTSLYGTILQVPSVVAVLSLNVFVNGRRHEGLKPIQVPLDGLVFGRNHIITVEPRQDQ
ncbi:MAG TPA: putative baseplate assembly protein [Blastocatellia bacterium]|nr:putative baseplate assembly protein [Blastocatellia bacterium]